MKLFRLKSSYIDKKHPITIYINVEAIQSVEFDTKRDRVLIMFAQHQHIFNLDDFGLSDLRIELAGFAMATFAEHRLLELEVKTEYERMEDQEPQS